MLLSGSNGFIGPREKVVSLHSKIAFGVAAAIAFVVAQSNALAQEKAPTAYEVMLELRTAAENECAKRGASCKAFTDIQRQLGEYIEKSCRALNLTSEECAKSPLDALLNQPAPRVAPAHDDENI